MNRLNRMATIIIILLLGAIILVWPLVTGLIFKRDFGATLENLSEPSRWSLHEREFKRGWFNSEVSSLLNIQGEWVQQLLNKQPLQLTLVHQIQHGPVLGPSLIPAAAIIETTAELPRNSQEWLNILFNHQSPLRIRSLIQFDGATVNRLESPVAQGKLSEGISVNWQGLGGTLEIGGVNHKIQGGFKVPLLELANELGQLHLEQLEMRIDYQHHQVGLWLGDIRLDLKTLSFMVPGKSEQRFALSGLSATTTAYEEQQTLSALISIDLEDLSVGGHSLGFGGLTVEMRGVDLLGFSNIYKQLQYLAPPRTQTEEIKQMIMAQLPNLIRHSLELGISRLDLKTAQGAIQGKVRFALTEADQLTSNITFNEILPHLGMEIEFSAPSLLVAELVQDLAQKELMARNKDNRVLLDSEQINQIAQRSSEQYLAALLTQGLIVQANNRYSTQLTFKNGQLNINGRFHNELLGVVGGER